MSGGPAGSGISYGRPHATRHVERAVAAAMASAGLDQVMGMFLFLTDDHLRNPRPALHAAARVARCTQVFGCGAMGVLTDEDWIIDSAGAAALVFGGGISASLAGEVKAGGPLISLATPEDGVLQWLNQAPRLGAIASSRDDHGPFRVWHHGRVEPSGVIACGLLGASTQAVVARGVRPLTAPMEVAEARGVNLVKIGKYPALKVLINALPPTVRELPNLPLHRLMCGVTFGDPQSAIAAGRYRLEHIVATNPGDASITLAAELNAGQQVFWALRDRSAAEQELQRVLQESRQASPAAPDFGLLFSCLSRGPGFYGGRDRDIEILRAQCPGMPFAGFYGNGEIGPIGDGSALYSYSAVMGLYRRSSPGA